MTEHIIEAHGIAKHFGGVFAVDDVSLAVPRGEIHGLVGENGAGKSTLMRVLAGILQPDGGRVLVDGVELEGGAGEAIDAGISLVHQELSLVPEMTVAENIMLGSMPTKAGFIDRAEQRRIAAQALAEINVKVDLDEPVARLSVALRQFVEIARAVARSPQVLILDEPTSALGQKQQMEVLKTIRKVQKFGDIAIILITHNEIHARLIADRFTFLSLGEVIGRGTSKDLEGDDIKRLMAGGAEIGDLAKELAV